MPVPVDTSLVTQRFQKRCAQCKPYILHGVVLVNHQVPVCMKGDVASAVAENLVKHVVKERKMRLHRSQATPVQIERKGNIRLLGLSLEGGCPGSKLALIQQEGGNLCPVVTDQDTHRCKLSTQFIAATRIGKPDGLASKIAGKLDIGKAIADHD